MIRGERIQLSPLTSDSLDILIARQNNPDLKGEYDFFGLVSPQVIKKHFSEDGMLSARSGSLIISLAGDLDKENHFIGAVDYRQQHYSPNEGGGAAYSIGACVIPEFRGKGYGAEAQRLLTAYLFATYPIMRVEAFTDITNIAEQRALEKAGFTREGVLRKLQWRNGAWHDMVFYSKIRGE